MRYATSFALAVVLYAGICSIALKPPPPGEGKQLYEVTLIPTPNDSPGEEEPASAEMSFVPTTLAESEATQSEREVLAFRPTGETSSDREPVEVPPHVHTQHLDPLATQEDTGSILDTTEPSAQSVGSQTVLNEPVSPEHREATNNTPPVEEDTPILDATEALSDRGEPEPVVDEPAAPEHRELTTDAPPIAHEHRKTANGTPPVALSHLELPKDLMQLPDLVINPPPEESEWRAIDKNLGIVTVAYSIDGRQPNIYLVWEADGSVEQVENLNRTGYSNRCRDRSQIEFFRRRLLHAKGRFGIRRPMRIIGLVPVETDRRFALAQTLAIESEGLEREAVAHTLAHYDLSAESRIRIDDLIKP